MQFSLKYCTARKSFQSEVCICMEVGCSVRASELCACFRVPEWKICSLGLGGDDSYRRSASSRAMASRGEKRGARPCKTRLHGGRAGDVDQLQIANTILHPNQEVEGGRKGKKEGRKEGRRTSRVASQRRFCRFRRIKIVEKFHAYRRRRRPAISSPPSFSDL